MKRFLILLTLASSSSLFAATDVGLAVGSLRGDRNITSGTSRDDFATRTDGATTLQLSFRRGVAPHFAVELSGFTGESDLSFRPGAAAPAESLGTMRMSAASLNLVATPLHLGRVAPYLSAGASYVHPELRDERLLAERGTPDLKLDDDWTWNAAAGADVRLTSSLSITAEARYLPIESRFTATNREPLPVEWNALHLSAGIRWKF